MENVWKFENRKFEIILRYFIEKKDINWGSWFARDFSSPKELCN